MKGVFWGKRKENGVWLAAKSRMRFMTPFSGHDSLYIAFRHFRLRIMCRTCGMKIYLDLHDWWIGCYLGAEHYYICLFPCVVIRLNRKT